MWSNGEDPYSWVVPPPAELSKSVTTEVFLEKARAAGVTGALIVQPINHKFDHSYVSSALSTAPEFFRGMCLANPTLEIPEAVAELEALSTAGYVGVRFNPGLFPEAKMDSEVGKALYAKAGELKMPVGVMAFSGLPTQLAAVEALLLHSPSTKLIIDHCGFFRQPATGALGDAASNDEAAWEQLLALAKHPQVYVKVSALFRHSAELAPFLDLQPRLAALLRAFGASRLMWGSDFPFVTVGPQATSYEQAASVPSFWHVEGFDEAARERLMGGTAAELFGFP